MNACAPPPCGTWWWWCRSRGGDGDGDGDSPAVASSSPSATDEVDVPSSALVAAAATSRRHPISADRIASPSRDILARIDAADASSLSYSSAPSASAALAALAAAASSGGGAPTAYSHCGHDAMGPPTERRPCPRVNGANFRRAKRSSTAAWSSAHASPDGASLAAAVSAFESDRRPASPVLVSCPRTARNPAATTFAVAIDVSSLGGSASLAAPLITPLVAQHSRNGGVRISCSWNAWSQSRRRYVSRAHGRTASSRSSRSASRHAHAPPPRRNNAPNVDFSTAGAPPPGPARDLDSGRPAGSTKARWQRSFATINAHTASWTASRTNDGTSRAAAAIATGSAMSASDRAEAWSNASAPSARTLSTTVRAARAKASTSPSRWPAIGLSEYTWHHSRGRHVIGE
eukprot:30891-Pelagococcus_subviridis.AAC.6